MAIHSSILAWKFFMARGVWQATVHRVAKSWTQPSDEHAHTHNQNFSMLQFEYHLEYKCRLFPLSYYLGGEARTGRKTYSRYLIACPLETTDMEDVTLLKTPEIGT